MHLSKLDIWKTSGQNRKYSLRADDVRSTPKSGLKSDIAPSPVCANSGLMHRRRVPLFDHLVDIGELLGQSRFPKALDHQLRIF